MSSYGDSYYYHAQGICPSFPNHFTQVCWRPQWHGRPLLATSLPLGETAAIHIMPATQNVINTCLREEVFTLNTGAQLTPIPLSSRLLLSSYHVPRTIIAFGIQR